MYHCDLCASFYKNVHSVTLSVFTLLNFRPVYVISLLFLPYLIGQRNYN